MIIIVLGLAFLLSHMVTCYSNYQLFSMGSQYLTKISVLHLFVFQTLPNCIHIYCRLFTHLRRKLELLKKWHPRNRLPLKKKRTTISTLMTSNLLLCYRQYILRLYLIKPLYQCLIYGAKV